MSFPFEELRCPSLSDTDEPNAQAHLVFGQATQALFGVYINFHKVQKSHYEGKTWVRMKQISFTVFLAQRCSLSSSLSAMEGYEITVV